MKSTHRLAAITAAAIGGLVPISAGSAALASAGPGSTGDRVATYAASAGHGLEAVPPGGTTLWLARYQGTGHGVGYAHSVVVSPDGSMVFVTGAVTAAYDAATGVLVWASPTGPGISSFFGSSAAVSPDGSRVFVTGESTGPSGALQYQTVAFDAGSGTQLWAAAYHGPGVGDDRPAAIAVSQGRVFVTGLSSNTRTAGVLDKDAYATVAYDAVTGAQLWASRYTDGNRDAEASAVATGPGGSQVYVTGSSAGPPGKGGFATVAYRAATGTRVWVARYNQDRKSAAAVAIVTGTSGSRVYVTGTTHSLRGQTFTTSAYTASSGAMRWVAHYTGPTAGNSAESMAISKDGTELAITGQGNAPGGHASYATLAYRTSNGTRLWVRYYGGTSIAKFGLAMAVAMSPDGTTVFVTGIVNGTPPGTATDYGTVAYSAATGATRWARLYTGPEPANDECLSLAVSPDGSKVFVTGGSPGPTGTAFATLAYQP